VATVVRERIEQQTPEDEEIALVAAAKRDRASFAPLYARYVRSIYRYCYRRLGSHEAAEDATSQTFVKAIASIERFEGTAIRGWLFTIADHVVTDILRRSRPNLPLEDALEIADSDDAPETQTLTRERALTVQEMLERLTPEQQQVVALRSAGFSGPEIAEITNKPLQSIKSLQFRAYTRLRKLLGDERMESR
jgi:RNA polymerase sigma-70 factor (ECF subfamily)